MSGLTDAFVIGASAGRKVNFVATAQAFRFEPLAWLLKRGGVTLIGQRLVAHGMARECLPTPAQALAREFDYGPVVPPTLRK